MADNKLSWTELRRALATRAGISEKEANTFLNAFNAQLVEALKQDKQVKINGLGIFKLQAVAPRKSVNVTTGEEIMIEGYNKVAFVPEAGVKELIEKTGVVGATAQALELTDDPIQKLGAQADEIVGILGELGQSPKEEPEAIEPKVVEPEATEPKVEEPEATEPKVVEPEATEPKVVEPEATEPKVEEPEATEPKVVDPEATEPKVVEPEAIEPKVVEPEAIEPKPEPMPAPKPKKRYHFVRDTLICVIILLLLLLVGYFFLREQIGGWIEEWMQPKPQTEQVEQTAEPVATDTIGIAQEAEAVELSGEASNANGEYISDEQILAEFLQASEEDDVQLEPTNEYPRLITTERIREGSRLAWISKRYYGAKIYWPYLYDANKDHLDDPNQIDVGTPIRIPKLTKTQLDTTNTATIATLERLREKAEAAMK